MCLYCANVLFLLESLSIRCSDSCQETVGRCTLHFDPSHDLELLPIHFQTKHRVEPSSFLCKGRKEQRTPLMVQFQQPTKAVMVCNVLL